MAVRIILVGGGAQSPAVQQVAAAVFGLPVVVPEPGEYVADGAARQAAAILRGSWPDWTPSISEVSATVSAPEVLAQYRNHAKGYVSH